MDGKEGMFLAYFENKTREFLKQNGIDPTLKSVEISSFANDVVDELVDLFEYKLKNYCVDSDFTCSNLTDVFKAIDDMHENIITAYETIDQLDAELEAKK